MVGEVQHTSVGTMQNVIRQLSLALCLGLCWTSALPAATLEKLSVEQMAEKATLIVRGRITGCTGETRGAVIYTRCQMNVSERWKGVAGSHVTFLVPGGRAHGLVQTFTGTPSFAGGGEYVVFLWAGRSGVNQIIGLSQGVFDLKLEGGQSVAKRPAAAAVMLDESGSQVEDAAVEMRVSELRQRVQQALASEVKQ